MQSIQSWRSDQFSIFFGDNNDENIFIHDIENHNYYDVHSFNSNLKQKECIILSVNVRSLMSKSLTKSLHLYYKW